MPLAYNYPLFFEKFFDSELKFDSLEDVVSIKYEFEFDELPEGWDEDLNAPPGLIDWIKTHYRKSE